LKMPPTSQIEPAVRLLRSAEVGENQGDVALGEWDIWLYDGHAGEVLTIQMDAVNPAKGFTVEERIDLGLLDTYLFVVSPDGTLVAANDNQSSDTTNSLVESLALTEDGAYQIHARSFEDQSAGPYTLIIEVEGD